MNAKNNTPTNQEAEWTRERQIVAQFGLSHTILYNLRREGKIRTVSLREQGKKYGARLYNLASIREFLANQEAIDDDSANLPNAAETPKP